MRISITDQSIQEIAKIIANFLIQKLQAETLSSGKEEASNPETIQRQEILITRKETANFLKISLVTLTYWTNSGKLKAYSLGRRRYYKKAEVIEAITTLRRIGK